jgi:hypothetical protein
MNHKRDKGNIRNVSDVFCFLELIGSCSANLQTIKEFEEYYPTLVWLQEEIHPTIQSIVDLMDIKLAVMYLHRTDRAVLRFKNLIPDEYEPKEHEEVDGLWMIAAMAMMIDDIMQAVRDPEKKKILETLEVTILDLQSKFDTEDFNLHNDANGFINSVVIEMRKK